MKPPFPHGPLVPLNDRVWQVTGSQPRIPLPRNMLIYRLASGGLLVHSAVALDEPGFTALAALGSIEVVIVPSDQHRMDARLYRERFPTAQFIGPRPVRDRIEKVVALDGTCDEVLPGLGVVPHLPDGTKGRELVYELPILGGVALVFCDLVFNLPHLPGAGGLVLRALGSTGYFGMTRVARRFLVDDKRAFGAWLRRMSDRTDVALVAMAHGEALCAEAPARLREAAARIT